MTVVAYVPDLMDRSRLSGHRGDVVFVSSPSELGAVAADRAADVVVVDLSKPEVLPALAGIGGRVVGFGPHVDRQLLRSAAEVGCTEVHTRSRFFSRIGEILAPR